MPRERDSKLDFESWMKNTGRIFSTQLTGEEKLKFLDHVNRLCSAAEIQFLAGLPDLLCRDFITLLPAELSCLLLSYFDAKTLFSACQVCQNWNSAINGNKRLWRQRCMLGGFRIPEEPCEDALFYKRLFVENSPVYSWRKNSFKMVKLGGHRKQIMAMYYYNGKVATGLDDETVRIWNCKTGECLSVFYTHSVAAVKFDDHILVTGSIGGTAASWDVGTGELLRCHGGHVGTVFCIDFDAPLDILVTGSADATLKLWSFSKGDLLRTLENLVALNEICELWISNVRVIRHANCPDRFSVLASNKTTVFCWAIDVKSTTVLSIEILFDSDEINDCLGWEFDGSFLTIASQNVFPSSNAIKETVYEFSEASGFVVRKTSVYPLLEKEIMVYSFLGSGKYFSVFLCEHKEEVAICITRRNAKVPPVLINFPSEYRPKTRRGDREVTLCDRRWLDGISCDIYGQAFLAFVFCNNSVRVLEFGSNKSQICDM